jgi:hypothetical protein
VQTLNLQTADVTREKGPALETSHILCVNNETGRKKFSVSKIVGKSVYLLDKNEDMG